MNGSLIDRFVDDLPQFGSCFILIAGLLVRQSAVGVFDRPGNPLTSRS